MNNLLLDYIKHVKYEDEPREITSIYASKLSNLLPDLLNELNTIPKKRAISKQGKEAIEFGNWYEDMLVSHFRKAGILIAPEVDGKQVEVIEGIVKGKIDAIVNLDDKRVIVEVKTCRQLPTEPKIEHLYQICYYVAYHPCDYGILHYADDRRDIVEFRIQKDSEMVEKVKAKVNRINEIYYNKLDYNFKVLKFK